MTAGKLGLGFRRLGDEFFSIFAADLGPPVSDGVEIFESDSPRINSAMAIVTGGVFSVNFKLLANGELGKVWIF